MQILYQTISHSLIILVGNDCLYTSVVTGLVPLPKKICGAKNKFEDMFIFGLLPPQGSVTIVLVMCNFLQWLSRPCNFYRAMH